MKVKKLYGCIDRETGELVPVRLSRACRYAWCTKGVVKSHFKFQLATYPEKYRLVELRPVPLLGDDK